ncbi:MULTISPECIES: hypothetical protein [unclassified Streptomyces]|uniref:hypothetical protein n=1 Tax=unclassified Streptomyces TaxID=2593676 RepID=UPI002E2E89B5|nr:hypothetical protein [Streptomyces sp. NBC_00228]
MAINQPKPVRLGENKKTDTERIHLFTLNDVEYSIPGELGTNIYLRYMWDKRSGSEYAEMDLLIAVLGEEAYQALMNYQDLTKEEWNQITGIIRDFAAGTMEEAGKN